MQQLTNPSPCIGLVTTASVQAQTATELRATEIRVKEHELEMGLRDWIF